MMIGHIFRRSRWLCLYIDGFPVCDVGGGGRGEGGRGLGWENGWKKGERERERG